MRNDSQVAMNWEAVLTFAENWEFAGYSDWRLPDAKELQSLIDYSSPPGTDNSIEI